MKRVELETLERRALMEKQMSLEEFLKWVDEDVWAEWEDRKVIIMSPASYQHQDIAGFLQALLRVFLEERNLGVVLSAPFAMWLPISNR
ncbi:MAG: Uma2 family endonuclease, partial [Armatimonadota bacterium]